MSSFKIKAIAAAVFWAAAASADVCAGQAAKEPYRRIVSIAPSLTETLFAVGAGNQVAGVTRFCIYPEVAKKKPKVGGYIDPSLEKILELEPDLVLVLHENQALIPALRGLGLNVKLIDQRTVAAILSSIVEIGELTGNPAAAAALVEELRKRIDRLKGIAAGKGNPTVLLAVSHDATRGPPQRVFVPQRQTFFGEMIELAGGKNIYGKDGAHFEMLSQEGIIALDPDVILDFVPGLSEKGMAAQAVIAQWAQVPGLRASRGGRVYIFDQPHAVVPGPRFIDILEAISQALHPEDRAAQP